MEASIGPTIWIRTISEIIVVSLILHPRCYPQYSMTFWQECKGLVGFLTLIPQRQSMSFAKKAQKDLLKKVKKENRKPEDPPTLGDKALLEKLIEYMRSVHAEMATLMAAARLGISVRGHEMYVTTFPCHECARLIVAAGLSGVTFIEPYPKSRVAEMYDDSIVVDEVGDEHHVPFRAFVGIAPRRFVEFFEAPEPVGRRPNAEIRRRNDDGTWVRWEKIKDGRWPRTYDMPIAIMNRELNALEKFEKQTAASGLKKPTTEATINA